MYKNILLIDDNAVDNFINSTFIKNCELGSNLNIFQSPSAALNFLRSGEKRLENTPGLIFLDIDMPEMNGFQFLEEFSNLSDPIQKAFKIIILSAGVNNNDISMGNDNPLIFKYLTKPLTSNFLLSIK